MTTGGVAAGVRIGELARRTGVSPELLRAWEQRYGVLQPARSAGGFRLYTSADEARIRQMTELIATGLSAAEAAHQALAQPPEPLVGANAPPVITYVAATLRGALDRFDSQLAHAALDQLLATVSIEVVVAEVLVPYLHDLGERWAAGEATVAQEHFAANLLRGRLLALSRDWGLPAGPSAVLACLPGEEHDLGLLIFAVLIARRGWRTTFLGANAPLDTVHTTLRLLQPAAAVLCTLDAALVRASRPRLRALANTTALHIAAPVEEKTLASLGAEPMPFDIVAAASSFGPPARARGAAD